MTTNKSIESPEHEPVAWMWKYAGRNVVTLDEKIAMQVQTEGAEDFTQLYTAHFRRELDVDTIMERVQEYASAWSLVGGPFDDGGMLDESRQMKSELRKMLEKINETK